MVMFRGSGDIVPSRNKRTIETERRLAERIALRFINLGPFDPWSDAAGSDWYARAREDIRAEWGTRADEFADVLAATSPQCDVGHNVKLAREEMRRRAEGLPIEAWIPCHAENLKRLRDGQGPKVRAFARALKGDDSAIVVDTWMLRASGVSERRRNSASVFRAVHAAIALVSRRTEFNPCQVQAMVWFHYRANNWIANKGAGDGYFPIRKLSVA